jgi:hypothetical protein
MYNFIRSIFGLPPVMNARIREAIRTWKNCMNLYITCGLDAPGYPDVWDAYENAWNLLSESEKGFAHKFCITDTKPRRLKVEEQKLETVKEFKTLNRETFLRAENLHSELCSNFDEYLRECIEADPYEFMMAVAEGRVDKYLEESFQRCVELAKMALSAGEVMAELDRLTSTSPSVS